jgi:hypothetical protein
LYNLIYTVDLFQPNSATKQIEGVELNSSIGRLPRNCGAWIQGASSETGQLSDRFLI